MYNVLRKASLDDRKEMYTISQRAISYQGSERLSQKRHGRSGVSCGRALTCGGCCCCWPLGQDGCCCGEVAGGVTGAQPLLAAVCCWKYEGCRRMPAELIGDGDDDGTTLWVDDRATVEGGWGDGPDEGLLWYEPSSPIPRVLPEENK